MYFSSQQWSPSINKTSRKLTAPHHDGAELFSYKKGDITKQKDIQAIVNAEIMDVKQEKQNSLRQINLWKIEFL